MGNRQLGKERSLHANVLSDVEGHRPNMQENDNKFRLKPISAFHRQDETMTFARTKSQLDVSNNFFHILPRVSWLHGHAAFETEGDTYAS